MKENEKRKNVKNVILLICFIVSIPINIFFCYILTELDNLCKINIIPSCHLRPFNERFLDRLSSLFVFYIVIILIYVLFKLCGKYKKEKKNNYNKLINENNKDMKEENEVCKNICIKCNYQYDENINKCPNCNYKNDIYYRCPNCSTKNNVTNKKCKNCNLPFETKTKKRTFLIKKLYYYLLLFFCFFVSISYIVIFIRYFDTSDIFSIVLSCAFMLLVYLALIVLIINKIIKIDKIIDFYSKE